MDKTTDVLLSVVQDGQDNTCRYNGTRVQVMYVGE